MLVRNARLADGRSRDVAITDGTITAVEQPGADLSADEAIDADGSHLLPGMIDCHVHFRQPGGSHKETWATGSRAAVAGGVTTVVDQPNTQPPTVTGPAVDQKAEYAAESLADFGLSGGVTPQWEPETLFDRPTFALGEVFLADSTGNMGIDEPLFRRAIGRAADAGQVVSVHAEDADLFEPDALPADDGQTGRAADASAWSDYRPAAAERAAVETALSATADAGVATHIAHTSTPEAVDLVVAADERSEGRQVSCEVTPHHLFLSREDARRLGTDGRMNPPLRSERRRAALFERFRDGRVDCLATDHAPHTRAEKDAPLRQAPSGVPGVETALPLVLAAARNDRLPLTRVRDATARTPADLFDLSSKGRVAVGYDADLVLVDLDEPTPIRGDQLHSNCGWTPFEGREGVFPRLTMVRGRVVYDPESRVIDGPFGRPVGRNVRRPA